MELSVDQLLYVGIVASVLTQGLALLAGRFSYVPSKIVRNLFLLGVSTVMSVLFFGLPEAIILDDPMDFVSTLLAQATLVFGSAAVIYALLLKRIVRPAPAA